jgi:hypothetical protein
MKWLVWSVAALIAFVALIIAGYYFLIMQGVAFSMST